MNDREAWLAERKFGIGGSDAAVIMGMSPWKSALQLWGEKTGVIEEKDLSDNESVYWGNVLEEVVANEFQNRHPELLVDVVGVSVVSEEHPFMRGNLDRVVYEVDGSAAVLEIKTVGSYGAKQWENETVPDYYLCQVQHYMAVTGYDKAYIAALIGGQKYVERLVLRDDAFISLLIEQERLFWETVQNNTPPDADGSDDAASAIKALYPASTEGKYVELPDEIDKLIAQKKSYEAVTDEYEAMVRTIDNKIRQAIGDAETGKTEKHIITYKSAKNGTRTLRIKEIKE